MKYLIMAMLICFASYKSLADKNYPEILTDNKDNFVNSLKASGLFQNIDIMNESSKKALGNNNLQFELKCVI